MGEEVSEMATRRKVKQTPVDWQAFIESQNRELPKGPYVIPVRLSEGSSSMTALLVRAVPAKKRKKAKTKSA